MAEPEDILTPAEQPEDKPSISIDELGKSLGRTKPLGYVPIPTNVDTVDRPQGSVVMAELRDSFVWGAMANTSTARVIDEEAIKEFKPLKYVPDDLLEYAFAYTKDSTLEQVEETTNKIRRERQDDALLSAYPIRSFAYGIGLGVFDPVSLLPFGAVYKNYKRGSRLMRGMVAGGTAGTIGAGVTEAVLQSTQLTRETQESVYNTLASGIFGAAIGSLAGPFGAKFELNRLKSQRAKREILNVLTEQQDDLTTQGLIKGEKLANIDNVGMKKLMSFSPSNRLLNSVFATSRGFADAIFSHGYTLTNHLDGDTRGASIERLIRRTKLIMHKHMADYQDIYFDMNGINKGFFRGTRDKLSEQVMNFDTFDSEVSYVLTTGKLSDNAHVNQGAEHLRKNVFDPIKKELIAIGELPEGATVVNAYDYFMIAYNKQKIMEQGGRSVRGAGTFPQALFNSFKDFQGELIKYKQSPEFIGISSKINANKAKLKGPSAEERKAIDKKIKPLNKKIRELESRKAQRSKDEIKKINEEIKKLTAERKQIQENISKKQKEFAESFEPEIKSFKDELATTKKKVAPFDVDIKKLETRGKAARDRKITLQERLKAKKKGTKAHESIKAELDKSNSVIAEIDKNIESLKSERDSIKLSTKKIQADIKRLQKLQKEEAQEIPGLKDKVKELEQTEKKLQISKKPSAKEIKSLENEIKSIKERIEQIEKEKQLRKDEKKAIEEELKALEKAIIDSAPLGTVNKKGELRKVLDDEALWGNVEQTVDHILGDTGGKLLNPFLNMMASTGGKPLKERTLLTDQASLRDWHITSASKVADMYVRATVPVIELTKLAQKFGAKNLSEFADKVETSLKAEFDLATKGKTGKEAVKLRKEFDNNLSDMKASIDLVKGVYGSGPNVLNNSAKQFLSNFRIWNSMRMLGNMTLSSIPDVALHVVANGPYRAIYHGLLPVLKGMKNVSKGDLQAIGYAYESELGMRVKAFADHEGLTTEPGAFSKAMDGLSQGFGNATVMNQWNSVQQNVAGTTSIHRTLDTIHKLKQGEKVRQKDIERLARLGIGKEHFDTIAKFTEGNIDGGTRYADWTNWDISTPAEAKALEQFQAGTGLDIDSIVIVPGLGDKPLLGNTEAGRMILQFKSFLMAATNKVLFAGIQRRHDSDVWLGVISMLAMGSVSYLATSLAKGQEPDLSFNNLAKESLDRSGLLGVFMEVYNIADKALGGGVSRYKTRGIWGALLGPSTGSVEDSIELLNKVKGAVLDDDTLSTKDVAKAARFVPYNNLFYIQHLAKIFVHDSAVSLGAIDAD